MGFALLLVLLGLTVHALPLGIYEHTPSFIPVATFDVEVRGEVRKWTFDLLSFEAASHAGKTLAVLWATDQFSMALLALWNEGGSSIATWRSFRLLQTGNFISCPKIYVTHDIAAGWVVATWEHTSSFVSYRVDPTTWPPKVNQTQRNVPMGYTFMIDAISYAKGCWFLLSETTLAVSSREAFAGSNLSWTSWPLPFPSGAAWAATSLQLHADKAGNAFVGGLVADSNAPPCGAAVSNRAVLWTLGSQDRTQTPPRQATLLVNMMPSVSNCSEDEITTAALIPEALTTGQVGLQVTKRSLLPDGNFTHNLGYYWWDGNRMTFSLAGSWRSSALTPTVVSAATNGTVAFQSDVNSQIYYGLSNGTTGNSSAPCGSRLLKMMFVDPNLWIGLFLKRSTWSYYDLGGLFMKDCKCEGKNPERDQDFDSLLVETLPLPGYTTNGDGAALTTSLVADSCNPHQGTYLTINEIGCSGLPSGVQCSYEGLIARSSITFRDFSNFGYVVVAGNLTIEGECRFRVLIVEGDLMLSPNAVLHIERTNDQLNSWHFSAGLEVAGRSHMSENSSLSSLNNGGCILRLESLILKSGAKIHMRNDGSVRLAPASLDATYLELPVGTSFLGEGIGVYMPRGTALIEGELRLIGSAHPYVLERNLLTINTANLTFGARSIVEYRNFSANVGTTRLLSGSSWLLSGGTSASTEYLVVDAGATLTFKDVSSTRLAVTGGNTPTISPGSTLAVDLTGAPPYFSPLTYKTKPDSYPNVTFLPPSLIEPASATWGPTSLDISQASLLQWSTLLAAVLALQL